MAKFLVTVNIISKREKELTIYAKDDDEACRKAEELVLGWDGVDDCDVLSVEEE